MDSKDLNIETERLIIRPYKLDDANALKRGIDESLEHLKPWMPWAHEEPQPIQSKKEKIQQWRTQIKEDTNYTLGIFDKNSGEFIGSTGFHKRNVEKILEIGYWVRASEKNKGFITESTRALTGFAFLNFEIEKLEIWCNDKNVASAKVPEKVGYILEFKCRALDLNQDGTRDMDQCWVIFKEDWGKLKKV